MAHHLSNILSTDYKTIAILCLLCALAAYCIKEYLAHPPLIIFVYPVLVTCSILAQYGFNVLEVYPNNRLDQWLMWTIMAAIGGTIVGIGLVSGAVIAKEKAELLGHGRAWARNRRRQILFCTATEPR